MRVVAGQLRGRRLRCMSGQATRPTTDRARQGLFDWLGPRVDGAEVLDLFAGSGAVGIEALSRGATWATFVERDRRAAEMLRRNLQDLELCDRARLIARDVRVGLQRLVEEGSSFQFLFSDPPYAQAWGEGSKEAGLVLSLLAPDAVMVVERSSEGEPAWTGSVLALRESRSYGGTTFDWYERAGED